MHPRQKTPFLQRATKPIQIVFQLVVAVVGMATFLAIGWALMHADYFSFRSFQVLPVEGQQLHYVTTDAVAKSLEGQLNGNFFTIDLDSVQAALQKTPWVKQVGVYRQWPNALIAVVRERVPLAYWNKDQLMSTEGVVFNPEGIWPNPDLHLPHLYGPEHSEMLVYKRYQELKDLLAPLQFQITQMELSDRYSMKVTLNTGLVLQFGRDPDSDSINPNDRKGTEQFLRHVETFVLIWPKVTQQLPPGKGVEVVDFRYHSGFFALKFKPTADEQKGKKTHAPR